MFEVSEVRANMDLLDNHLQRLHECHKNARSLQRLVRTLSEISLILRVTICITLIRYIGMLYVCVCV